MNRRFLAGARSGFRIFLPLSIGLIPWALVTGVALTSAGLSVVEAMGMNLMVYAGVAQIATLPLIVAGAPLWLIGLTALALNLRFLIFSAAIAKGFHDVPLKLRIPSGYLLIDGVFAVCTERMLSVRDRHWRFGYFLGPSLWGWGLWQCFVLTGVLGAGALPQDWSLEFMATIALMVILVPLSKNRAMLVAALVGGVSSVLLRGMPLKLGVIVAIVIGIIAGFVAGRVLPERKEA
ncbi:AzlC family ABC transporter permease [Denitromonas ohlonensis]|uniref:Branched-chain amino acid ABC transporter permease n=2 Tax=Denitromonas TaxID=139331 RepID=A0A557RBW3_9RHOO|nr:AzlC family ABC transporter permease [Denitromonas ohlonensis]TVO62657.1 branched-chain amino acid ABC transporter permease [Denitromonas ohlonensis]TVO78861.1 branched-chain amino acid ABC transporter permease [Denitromonas ohlonensis]